MPKPNLSTLSSQSLETKDGPTNIFEQTTTENSIEVYDDNFVRNSILTRSARMRKFKFYQYKPCVTAESSANKATHQQSIPQSPILIPRDDVLDGRIAMIAEQSSKELNELDDEIGELEKKITELRNTACTVSDDHNNTSNVILDQIFELVNKKNDLLRRQMQLNILSQEKKLEKANEELTKELRQLMSIDDSRKTKADLDRQKHLYEQSLALVNKRNELVFHLDVQEKAIEDDNFLKEQLKTVISKQSGSSSMSASRQSRDREENCCIQ